MWNTIQIQSDISEKCGIHCLVFCYAMQKYKNKKSKRGELNFCLAFTRFNDNEGML